jgi:hypothetical protein
LVVGLAVKFRQEADYVLALESAVTPRGNAVCSYCSFVAPTPQGVGMDMEELGYFPYRQHVSRMFGICHIFPYLLFN